MFKTYDGYTLNAVLEHSKNKREIELAKDIKNLEALLKDCADELSLNIAYCKNAPTIKNRAWQLHDKILNLLDC